MKKAFITGVTGQDGSYLAELLLLKGYEVHGLIRRSSTFNTGRLAWIYQDPHDAAARFFLHYGDLTDGSGLARLLAKIGPDEIYNLGAQSHVRVSFDMPAYTFDVVAGGTIRLLEAIREVGLKPRFYQASSSEMFGGVDGKEEVGRKKEENIKDSQALIPPGMLNEGSPFRPRSPYAVAKVAAHWAVVNAREAYGLHASNGILFNHESPRRGETFVTRKITMAAARIAAGLQKELYLGNLDARRDWGYAKEYVEAMWLMLQQDAPDDYVVATGIAYEVHEFLALAFSQLGLLIPDYVRIDPRYFRPTEVDVLIGDASKAREKLGWRPYTDVGLLVKIMVEADVNLVKKELSSANEL